VCAGAYLPLLEDGKLVKAREPAYQMAEKTRARDCLSEIVRMTVRYTYQLPFNQIHHSAGNTYPGYPDAHLWVPVFERDGRRLGGHLFAEQKKMDRSPEPDQVRVMTELIAAGSAVYLWRPCCLFSGYIDRCIAAFAGVQPLSGWWTHRRTAEQPTKEPWQVPVPRKPKPDPAHQASAAHPAKPTRSRKGAARKSFELPGWDEPALELSPLRGYVVPMPSGSAPHEVAAGMAYRKLEAWLTRAGFPPATVSVPVRFIVGRTYLAVQVPTGLSTGGVPAPRVWRYAAPTEPFPEDLVTQLGAWPHTAANGDELEQLLAAAEPPRPTEPE
jgi:hypothetical protein